MDIFESSDNSAQSPAVILGRYIRQARKRRKLTIAEFAEKLGRQREWLNRVELGYSEYGEYPPVSASDLQTMVDILGEDAFEISQNQLLEHGERANAEYYSVKSQQKEKKRPGGKLTHTEVIIGEKQIVQAITGLVQEQHSDAIIRNTGIKTRGNYLKLTSEWKNYREALGDFLSKNPNAMFKRVEYAANIDHLQKAKDADRRVAGARKVEDVHNAKIKFHKDNPLQLHAIIGQREAILALPQVSGQSGSNIALLVRDKIFVEALRAWYDEVLWDAPGENKSVDFQNFDESFQSIQNMYGYENQLTK